MSLRRGVRAGLVWHCDGTRGRFTAALPAGAAGRWCRLAVCVPGVGAWWAKLEVTDPARGQIVREAFLGPIRRHGKRATLLHVPSSAAGLALHVFRAQAGDIAAPTGSFRVLSRARAAWELLRHGWRLIPGVLAGDAPGRFGLLRAVLGQAPARAGEAPGYTMWCALYDRWGEAERAALCATGKMVADIGVLVVGEDGAGRAASLASVAQQWKMPAWIECLDTLEGWSGGAAPWTLVVRAGDTLAPHALACFALEAARHEPAELVYADTDDLTPAGRVRPLLKPGADARLLRAGLLTRGAVLVRGDVRQTRHAAPGWPDKLAGHDSPDRIARVPFVLTHVAHAEVPDPGQPLPEDGGEMPFVSIVIPSGLRSRHVLRCLRRVVESTNYPAGFEVVLAVSRIDPGDMLQAALCARAARMPTVRVLDLGLADFNYARVNNIAVAQAQGPLILLLNDDVAPIRPDWLTCMVAARTGADGWRAGIVGARLLYGNGRVQHGGVIMGLAHLCEHAFRLAPAADGGPHGLAQLDREVSAVTGACLLVGSDVYLALGGMDESYAIALNDVDFCLRAREAGILVVLAASVELHHYEGLSLGRHYAGARAALESLEVRRLRDRWAAVIASDPFYHPNASLEPGREFQPGFPPRLTPLSWIAGDPVACG